MTWNITMKLLTELLNEANINDQFDALELLCDEYESDFNSFQMLLSEADDDSNKQLMATFDETIKMFAAAKKGLSIVYRLKNPEDKKKHHGRITGTLNTIRANLHKIAKALSGSGAIPKHQKDKYN
jgi:hypothetical protein